MSSMFILCNRKTICLHNRVGYAGHGSIHETTCRVCFGSGTLKPCYTCRLAFHVDCIPRDSLYKSSDLFCSICVNRGWHVSPPELTPPPSPTLGPTPRPEVAVESEPVISVSRTMSIPNLVSSALDPRPRPPSSTLQASQEVVSDSLHLNQTSDHVHHPPTTTINHSPPRHTQISDNNNNNNNNSVEPARPKRQRKSRYATLSSEVDASLAVLYHELESIASLKAQVEDLQNQTLRDAQVIKLRENSIAILRRDLEQRRTAEQEMVQFRAMKPQYDSLQRELDEVRAKNAALELELQESREETAAAKETVNDWKGKLSQLLGN